MYNNEDMVKSIAASNSKNTLREFWTAPGSYKPSTMESTNHSLKLRAEKTSLKTRGDLAWWSLVSSEELALFCRYLQKINSSLIITFDDILLPNFELVRDSI
ncbi:unnamed protein product [Allacma fusca]|uniref:Uncharacterized protein n=1 Tax=Allacma fusca TaxID=39272 RepID=A0A8J2P383_9HEXA|nr:unnamed protein product [Allacma fusca]